MVFDDFIWRAVIAGAGVAIAAGPLGCFVVWKRLAYFGDTMAHSALLGVALGFMLGIEPMFGVIAIGMAVAVSLSVFMRQRKLANDTVLGTLSHTSLALGILVISMMTWVRVDLMGYLFGDILAVTRMDLFRIFLGSALVLIILIRFWRQLLVVTLDEELARAEGLPAWRFQILLMLIIAGVIALAMKIVGILLVTSLLIIPAAAARRFSRTPEQMAFGAVLIGNLSVVLGILASLHLDTPAGPSIVVAAMLFFVFGQVPLGRLS